MRKLTRIIFIIAITLFFGVSFISISSAQRRGRVFSHATSAHNKGKYNNCSSCHTLPTDNWTTPRRDKQDPFPDVRNYPYKRHTTCNNCHINEVFSRGAIFCGSCHVTPSMKATGGRGVLPFPNTANPRQFTTIFPHDVHQDIIASNRPERDYATAHFIPAVFTKPDDKPKVPFYNCTVCHQTISTVSAVPKYELRMPFGVKPLSAPFSGTDADANKFTEINPLKASYFKNSPDGHESCFTCHYQFQNLPKGKQDCSGCHVPAKPFFEKDSLKRYSLRFNHERDGHNTDCLTCHLRITQNDDVRKKSAGGISLAADVPFVTCVKCHDKVITDEIGSREKSLKDKAPAFQCVYCHTAVIGRYEIPSSHSEP